jgi:enamine deaminase RidA (YjgF/YER057c/UK114 family)
MALEFISPDGLFNSPAYTHVVRATSGDTVYIAGQTPVDADGNLVGGDDLEAQMRRAYANLEQALAAVGATAANVAKTTTYVVNYSPDMRPIQHRVRSAVFGDTPPANTLVGVQALAHPDFLFEVEAVAVLD